jgi:Arc/MetJ-type ribon-helix-helix transcriptional regulator
LPGWIRRVELLQHDDAPMIEPGQLMPRLVFGDPVRSHPHPDPRKVAKHARTFKMAIGLGLNQFRDTLMERWPEIRYFELLTEDNRGQRTGGGVRFVEDGREVADGEFTNVMVRLKTAELDIVDTLIAAGIANNRAEAVRWALIRISERPAYEQLLERTREHTRDIERLKSEF